MQYFRPFLFGMLGGIMGFFASLMTLAVLWGVSV